MGPYRTTRIWEQTLRKLRLIAALTNSSMVQVIDRLADEELKRLKEQKQEQGKEQPGC
jgi:hypothetical protein